MDHARPSGDPAALFKLSYGLYLLTAREDGRDNGCIVNSVIQLTSDPVRVAVAVNRQNHTCGMIARTGLLTLAPLDESAPFALFCHFGFQSGREVDKFARHADWPRAENGLRYPPAHANAVLSATVETATDYGSHTLFVAALTGGQVLSDAPSCTYAHYFSHIKPAPEKKASAGTRWVCKICGYVYEGEQLPPDFICPICKHPASDFERQ